MTHASFHIVGVSSRAKAVHEKLAFSTIEGGEVIIKSPLEQSQDLNSHLVWMWGFLKHERRYLKSLQADGAKLICNCKVPKGKVHLLPNAAEMLHLLGAELILEVR